MINFLAGMVSGGIITLIVLCVFTVNQDKPKHTGSTGVAFWLELLPSLWDTCGPAAYPFLTNKTLCMGSLHKNTLTVQVKDEFSYQMIAKANVIGGLEAAASAKAGRPITVILLHNGEVNDD